MNEYEIKRTSRFEGAYTPEEIELNNLLLQECTEEVLDCERIEELLRRGADPLGATAVSGWGLLDHIYGEIISDLLDFDSANLPRITELLLKHGMNVDKPRVPYDDRDSLHPMWELAFAMNENAAQTLKLLLDSGISADAAGEMWGHAILDLTMIECGDPVNDPFWNSNCVWTMKLIMLCASYDHIINQDEDLRKFIGCAYNHYDLHNFRNWNDFYYRFDTSRCGKYPRFSGSVVHIYEAASDKEVWKVEIR